MRSGAFHVSVAKYIRKAKYERTKVKRSSHFRENRPPWQGRHGGGSSMCHGDRGMWQVQSESRELFLEQS